MYVAVTANSIKRTLVITITTYTARRFRGPVSQRGAGKDAGSCWQVTWVTAIL